MHKISFVQMLVQKKKSYYDHPIFLTDLLTQWDKNILWQESSDIRTERMFSAAADSIKKPLQCSLSQSQTGWLRGTSLPSTRISAFKCIDPPDTNYLLSFFLAQPFFCSWLGAERAHVTLAGLEKEPQLNPPCRKLYPHKRQKFRAQVSHQEATEG